MQTHNCLLHVIHLNKIFKCNSKQVLLLQKRRSIQIFKIVSQLKFMPIEFGKNKTKNYMTFWPIKQIGRRTTLECRRMRKQNSQDPLSSNTLTSLLLFVAITNGDICGQILSHILSMIQSTLTWIGSLRYTSISKTNGVESHLDLYAIESVPIRQFVGCKSFAH